MSPVSEGEDGRIRILAFAYACEPEKGSEPAAGWVCARMLAQLADVWVLTRQNNQQVIDDSLARIPEREHLHFEYVDLPAWMRLWKRGNRGARLYYFLWQLAAVRRAFQLRKDLSPELIWHLTWGNAWFGSLAPLLPYRFVYGPVGGGTGTAWRLWRAMGWRGNLFEVARTLTRFSARYLNPAARLAWHRAELILVQNPETRDWLPARHRRKAAIFPHAVLEEEETGHKERSAGDGQSTALYVGRLVPWKGVALAIGALALLPRWRLVICGIGSDERRLKRMARTLGVADRIEFLGWLPRDQVRVLMAERADIFIFPSVHDDAPFAVAEALAAHVPVVCLDRGGPPVLGGTAVKTSRLPETVAALAESASRLIGKTPPPYPDLSAHTLKLRSILLEKVSATAFPGRLVHPRPAEEAQ